MNTRIHLIILTTLMCMVLMVCQARNSSGENRGYAPELIKIGFSSKFLNDVSHADAQVALGLWIRELSKTIGIKGHPKPFIYDNLQELASAVTNKEVDLIAITTMDYLSIKDAIPLEPALVGKKGNSVGGEDLIILVRRDQSIAELSQLKGKKIILHAGVLRDTAHVWLRSILARKNLPDRERFFGSIQEVKKASQSVLPVFFRQADAALVARSSFETMVELNPQIGKELIVLSSSEKLLYGVFAFNKELRDDIKRRILDNSINLHATAAGKQIFLLFQIEDISPYKPSYLASSVALLSNQNTLKARGSSKKTD